MESNTLSTDTENEQLKVKQLIKLAQISGLPQIVVDSFSENEYTSKSNEILIQRATLCYKEYSKLINILPNDMATAFIYEFCIYENNDNEIVNCYNYYKGYKDVFYLIHGYSGVFIAYNGVSLKKDPNKYISDYSWGYIDTSSIDYFVDDKRISGNTTQTAEVILKAIFEDDENKANLNTIFIDSFLIENSTYQTNSSFSKDDIIDWYNSINLIKRVCIEYKLTYREFGEKVGFGEGAIKNAAASGKISDQLKKAIEMFLDIQRLTKENKKFKQLQNLMKEIINL
jgi:hypothetical protein